MFKYYEDLVLNLSNLLYYMSQVTFSVDIVSLEEVVWFFPKILCFRQKYTWQASLVITFGRI